MEMSKSEFITMSVYILLIGILSLVVAFFGPPLMSQVVLAMICGSGLMLLGIVALMRWYDRKG